MKLKLKPIKKMGVKRRNSDKTNSSNQLVKTLIKGSLVSLCISLVGILVFAFILKFTNIPESVIAPVNQVIKGLSVFIGVFIGLKKSKEMGLVSGLLIGLVYTILAFFVFSILAGSFVFDRTLLNDIIFGAIMGSICGIICVNIKKSSN